MDDTEALDDGARTLRADWTRQPVPRAPNPPAEPQPDTAGGLVSFDRFELREILNLYGRKVAEGEWRDYAMDFAGHKAVFSIYRRSSECALFRIEKQPRLARKQGLYSVIAATGLVMKRGQDLRRVLAVLDKRLKLVAG